jgi:uncharacterized membrane protein YhaH (DUF805 family)
MLVKDIKTNKTQNDVVKTPTPPSKNIIDKKNMKKAWGDVFDYYLRGITENYLYFHGRASRLEFWGFMTVSGMLLFLLNFLGNYIENQLIVYYYLLATLLPMFAVTVRRFHDINKKAFGYLFSIIIPIASCFFIGIYSVVLFIIWGIIIICLLGMKTDFSDGLFGFPKESDEVFGDDNEKIIKKFFKLAIVIWVAFFAYSYVLYDNWKKQNDQKMAYEYIIEMANTLAEENDLSTNQRDRLQNDVRNLLKTLAGQSVSERQINEQINLFIQQIKEPQSLDE